MSYPEKLFYHTNAPKRHQKFHVDMNRSEGWRCAHEQLKRAALGTATACVLGLHGRGKTQSAVIAIAMMRSKGRTAYYTKAVDLFTRITEAKRTAIGEHDAKQKYIKPHFLVIDAFQNRGNTSAETRIITDIVDKRYDLEKPTLIIANDTKESIFNGLGSDPVERMKQGGGIIFFDCENFRELRNS